MVRRYTQLYLETKKALAPLEPPQGTSFVAQNLLCKFSGLSRELFLIDRGLNAPEQVCQAVEDGVRRLLAGEPLAYVLGEWDFYGMTLLVTPDVLIPRDDTCAVTDLAIKQALFLEERPRILDLCTGSGCIGLAIASRVKDARVTLADISKEALAVARKNARAQGLTGRANCLLVDALEKPGAFLGKFDLIVSNPPYVTASQMEALPESVRAFEPHLALFGGADGLDFYRSIAQNFREALKPGGLVCLEFGMGQGDGVCNLLKQNGFTICERAKDNEGIERAVLACYDRKEDGHGQ